MFERLWTSLDEAQAQVAEDTFRRVMEGYRRMHPQVAELAVRFADAHLVAFHESHGRIDLVSAKYRVKLAGRLYAFSRERHETNLAEEWGSGMVGLWLESAGLRGVTAPRLHGEISRILAPMLERYYGEIFTGEDLDGMDVVDAMDDEDGPGLLPARAPRANGGPPPLPPG